MTGPSSRPRVRIGSTRVRIAVGAGKTRVWTVLGSSSTRSRLPSTRGRGIRLVNARQDSPAPRISQAGGLAVVDIQPQQGSRACSWLRISCPSYL